MKDPRGVERGACTKCSCTAYEYVQNSERAACAYCECPAPAHEDKSKGTASANTTASSNVSFGSSFESITVPVSPFPVIDPSIEVIEIPNSQNIILNDLMNRGSTQESEPTSDEIESMFPKNYGKIVDKALQTKTVLSRHKDLMCRKIVDRLVENQKASNSCLKKAARKIVNRYSPFKSTLPKNEIAVYEKLKRRRNRLNLDEKRPGEVIADTEEESLSAADAKKKMQSDWAAGIRRVEVFRPNMVLTRMLRVDESKKLPGLQLMNQYPALALSDLVLEEYAAVMEVDIDTMRQNWERSLPNLLKYYKEEKIPYLDEGSLAQKTLSILEALHLVPLWKKKDNLGKRTTFILEKFAENTPISEMRPSAKDPPRLIATGDPTTDTLEIQCYFDTEPFFVVKNPVDAILLLLSAYFLFGIKWFPATRMATVTLVSCTAGTLKVALDINRNNKFVDFLKRINVL